jgi:hypothetical protein
VVVKGIAVCALDNSPWRMRGRLRTASCCALAMVKQQLAASCTARILGAQLGSWRPGPSHTGCPTGTAVTRWSTALRTDCFNAAQLLSAAHTKERWLRLKPLHHDFDVICWNMHDECVCKLASCSRETDATH